MTYRTTRNLLYAMRSEIRVVLFTLCLALLSTGSGAQDATLPAGEYSALRPGDLVRVQIWREGELSGDFPVNSEGTIIFPLLGEVQAVDLPLDELRDLLIDGYRVHLRNPSITITPLRRVNILGEVRKPGLYPVDLTVSLAGAVAIAGGTTEMGDLDRIMIVRGGEVIHKRIGAGETLESADIRSGDHIFVERRSWLDRNSTFLVSALLSVTSIVTSIILATRDSGN